jgi:hypothetical protein
MWGLLLREAERQALLEEHRRQTEEQKKPQAAPADMTGERHTWILLCKQTA